LNRTLKAVKENHYKNTLTLNKSNPKNLWQIINELSDTKTKKKNFPVELDTHDGIIKDPQKICNEMNNFFVNIGKNLANSIKAPSTVKPLLVESVIVWIYTRWTKAPKLV